ncbi:MAG: hypothetical protein ABIH20_02810 [Candidatus Diapherotrites archaeon]
MGALREIIETIRKLLLKEKSNKIVASKIEEPKPTIIKKIPKLKPVVVSKAEKPKPPIIKKTQKPEPSVIKKVQESKPRPVQQPSLEIAKPVSDTTKKLITEVKKAEQQIKKSVAETKPGPLVTKKVQKPEPFVVKKIPELKPSIAKKTQKPKSSVIKKLRKQKHYVAKKTQKAKPAKTLVHVKEIEGYRKIIRSLRKEVEKLKKQVEQQSIGPKQALSGVRVIYDELKGTKVDVDSEIKKTKNLMNYLESDFLKRKIQEDLFKEKMFNYREKLHLLSIEKKELASQKKDLTVTTKKIPHVVPVSLEQLSKTDNLENLLVIQQEALEKIAKQRPVVLEVSPKSTPETAAATSKQKVIVPSKSSASEPKPKTAPIKTASAKTVPIRPVSTQPREVVAEKEIHQIEHEPPEVKQQVVHLKRTKVKAPDMTLTPEIKGLSVKSGEIKAPESKTINSFLEKKAQGKIDEQKLGELEGKVERLMKQYNISENEIEKKLGNTETGDLVASVNKLVSILELEKKANQTLNPEKIETAMRFTTPMKKKEEVKGIVTEIKKQRIVTDFDKVLNYISKNEEAKMGKIAKELNIPRKRVEECCNLLEKEKQVLLLYSPIGDAVVMTPDHKEKLDMAKLNKKKKR